MAVELNSLLWSRPGMCGGRLCAAGSGVSVRRIAIRHQQGESPEEILRSFPHLTLATVHAALAYYFANQRQMDAEIAAEDAESERLAAEAAKA